MTREVVSFASIRSFTRKWRGAGQSTLRPGELDMAATTSGTKTVTRTVAPHLTAAMLTTLLATPIENLTVAQLEQLLDALKRLSDGKNYARTIGSLLT